MGLRLPANSSSNVTLPFVMTVQSPLKDRWEHYFTHRAMSMLLSSVHLACVSHFFDWTQIPLCRTRPDICRNPEGKQLRPHSILNLLPACYRRRGELGVTSAKCATQHAVRSKRSQPSAITDQITDRALRTCSSTQSLLANIHGKRSLSEYVNYYNIFISCLQTNFCDRCKETTVGVWVHSHGLVLVLYCMEKLKTLQ